MGRRKVFQKLVLRTPLVIVPTFIGEVEQDYMYWPLKFKQVAEQWRVDTAWGQLFQQYQRLGCLAPARQARAARAIAARTSHVSRIT